LVAALRTLGNLPPDPVIAIGDTLYDVEAAKKKNLATRYYQSPLAG